MFASENARKDDRSRGPLGAGSAYRMRSFCGIWLVALVNSTGCSSSGDEPRVDPDETADRRDTAVLDSENGPPDTIAEFDSDRDAIVDTSFEADTFDRAEAPDVDAFEALDVDDAADSALEEVEGEVDVTTPAGDSSVLTQDGVDAVPQPSDTISDTSETGVDGLDSGQQPSFDYLIPILLEILDDN